MLADTLGDLLVIAATDGHVNQVRMYLALGANPNAHYRRHGYSITHNSLSAAACNGHKKIVQVLIEAGADVNATCEGNTALILMAQSYYASVVSENEIVQILLDAGAHIDNQNDYGDTALIYNCRYNRHETAMLLLAAGANGNLKNSNDYSALEELCGDLSCYETNNPDFLVMWNKTFQALLAAGADVNQTTSNGAETLLTYAAKKNSPIEIISALVKAGANVNATNSNGDTPLNIATANYAPDIIHLLLDANADANIANKHGNTPLMTVYTAYQSNKYHLDTRPEKLTSLLLTAGARVDTQNEHGHTALMCAAHRFSTIDPAHCDMVAAFRLLMEAGSDAHLKGKDGQSAMDLIDKAQTIKKVMSLT